MHHIEIISRLEDQHLGYLRTLTDAATQADGHEPIGEHKFLRMKHGDDLALGMMALEGERLVGYAHTLTYETDGELRVSCELVVHPAVRRQGLGGRLLAEVIAHAERQQARVLNVWAYNDSPVSRHFAEEFGLAPGRRLLHMHRHPGPAPYIEPPEGTTIRPFRVGADEEMLLRLNNRIFEGHPENGSWTLEDLLARTSQSWFRAGDILILEAHGRASGFCWLKVEERTGEGKVGEVYVIGTAPEHQGVGLGRFLLSRGLTHLHERGVDAVAVYVDQSNARGVALYWALDFHHHHVDVCYSRPL
jgi:mycothiol synthase